MIDRANDTPWNFSLASLFIWLAGFCVALVALPAFIVAMGGLPDPGRQSDFFIETLMSQLIGSCCLLGIIGLVTVAANVYIGRRRRGPSGHGTVAGGRKGQRNDPHVKAERHKMAASRYGSQPKEER